MRRNQVYLKAALVLVVLWAGVWVVRSQAASRKATAEGVRREIAAARFEDWSQVGEDTPAAERARREETLRRIAGMVNRLDFNEREKNRNQRDAEGFFRKLSPGEKALFIDLTIVESMNRFMESLDAMPAEQRKRFVEQGLREITEGRTAADMDRARELDSELLDKITREGMRAYFEKSSADTKLDLAPLMEAMNETMQGLRGNQFGPRNP